MTRVAYTADEVAEMLGLHSNTVRNMVKSGTLKRVPNTGRVIRIAATELESVFGVKVEDVA